MFIGGYYHLLTSYFAYTVFITIILLSIYYIYNNKLLNPLDFYKSLSLFEKILIFLLIIILLTSLIRCFVPITGMDTLTARANAPKRYIQHHGFENLPQVLASNNPMGTSMLYLFSMLMFPVYSLNLVAYFISIILIYSVYFFGKEYFNSKIGLLAVILVATTQVFYAESWTPLEDLLLANFCLLAIWSILKYFDDFSTKHLILFGLFSGTVLVVKLNGAVFVTVLYVYLLYKLCCCKKCYLVLVPLLFSILMYLPWCIKSFIYTGNPFYPFADSFFSLKYPYNYLIGFPPIGKSGYSIFNNIMYFFTHFLSMFTIPVQINKYYTSMTGMSSPIILILILLAIYYKLWKNKYFLLFFTIAIINYAIQFFLLNVYNGPYTRFIFIDFILFSIIGSWAYFMVTNKSMKLLLNVLILSWVIVFTVYTTWKKIQVFPYAVGIQSVDEFHENMNGAFEPYKDFTFLNNEVVPPNRVLLFDPRAFYLNSDYDLSKNVFYILKKTNSYNADSLYNYMLNNNLKYLWFDDDLMDQDHPEYYFLLGLTKTMINKYNLECIYANKKINTFVYKLF